METFYNSDVFEENKIEIYFDDCLNALKNIKDNSVDLIITSPPYADQRKNSYGGISPHLYVNWFLPISQELLRVLKPTGTFILNIKEKIVDGERHIYVIDLIKELKNQGWLWTEEFCWSKTTSFPGKWPNRFRDSWERLLQFNKEKKFNMYQEEVMIPVGEWAKKRLSKLSNNDKKRKDSVTGSKLGTRKANWEGRDKVYPTNVLNFSPETGNKKHSAVFPERLPSWFIRLFTKKGDIVLDPFLGSGTTCIASLKLCRNSIGIEKKEKYYELARQNIEHEICSKK